MTYILNSTFVEFDLLMLSLGRDLVNVWAKLVRRDSLAEGRDVILLYLECALSAL